MGPLLTAGEWAEFCALDVFDPSGDRRADLHAAIIAAATAAAGGGEFRPELFDLHELLAGARMAAADADAGARQHEDALDVLNARLRARKQRRASYHGE